MPNGGFKRTKRKSKLSGEVFFVWVLLCGLFATMMMVATFFFLLLPSSLLMVVLIVHVKRNQQHATNGGFWFPKLHHCTSSCSQLFLLHQNHLSVTDVTKHQMSLQFNL